MDQAVIRHLNDINRAFYRTTADSFDETRQHPWPGWSRVASHLTPPFSVLDIGCGNGRFGVFLSQRFSGQIRYHGLDNNAALLDHARESLAGLDAILELRDVIENPPDGGQYDLVALFGVLHHIPGRVQRQDFVHTLAQCAAPGGLLAFACWRFYEYDRFRARIVPWSEGDISDVEPNDFLLDWRRGSPALRYCHYIDDAEHAELVAATGLTEIDSYRADGETNDVNRYSVLDAESTL